MLDSQRLALLHAYHTVRLDGERYLHVRARANLQAVFRLISDFMVQRGWLSAIVRDANSLLAQGPERRSAAFAATAAMVDPLTRYLQGVDPMQRLVSDVREYDAFAFDLGAIAALSHLGVRARSPVVEAYARRASIRKDAGAFTFELTDSELRHALDTQAGRFGAGITGQVSEDSRGMVWEEVYQKGKDVHDTAKTIAKAAGIPEWRGLKIARTEMQQSFQTASYEMHKRSGVLRHTWFTVGDRRVRPEHRDNDGVRVEIGKTFPSGQIHPGDGPLSVNCRCSVFPDLDDPNIILQPWPGDAQPTFAVEEPRLPREPRAPRVVALDRGARVREKLLVADEDGRKKLDPLYTELGKKSRDLSDGIQEIIEASKRGDFVEADKIRAKVAQIREGYTQAKKEVNAAVQRLRDKNLRILQVPKNVQSTVSAEIVGFGKGTRAVKDGSSAFQKLVVKDVAPPLPVTVRLSGTNRAYYHPGTGEIVLSASSGKRTMVHEMGHWLENHNEKIKQKIRAFYRRRTANERLQMFDTKLGYTSDEVFKKDKFIDNYMGKQYDSGDTELVSMGLEYLVTDPVKLAKGDPELFDFVVDLIRGFDP